MANCSLLYHLIVGCLLSLKGECSNLTCQVTPQDLETVLVTWSGTHHGPVEIVFGPLGVSYYIVHPVVNPLTTSTTLENLLPFTSYQLLVRSTTLSSTILQSDTVYFNTSDFLSPGDPLLGRNYKVQEVFLILFVLVLWVVVLCIFFQRWGKIRSLLPYQPVYSKEMVEKIEKIETEKKIRNSRTSFSFFPIESDNGVKQGIITTSESNFPTCQTSSTICLPYSCTKDMACEQRRKTKSAEHVSCPRIVIDKSVSQQLRSSSQSLPMEGERQPEYLLNIPGGNNQDSQAKHRKSGNCSQPFIPSTISSKSFIPSTISSKSFIPSNISSKTFIPSNISSKTRAISESFLTTLRRSEEN